MNSTLARRFALTLATAGIAVLSSVAVAPAASAAPAEDGPSYDRRRSRQRQRPGRLHRHRPRPRPRLLLRRLPGKHAKKCIADSARTAAARF